MKVKDKKTGIIYDQPEIYFIDGEPVKVIVKEAGLGNYTKVLLKNEFEVISELTKR
jgi:hypothetical protein